MIDKDLIFLLLYEESEFVTLDEVDSPTPTGYTRKNTITKTFTTKKEMDDFIEVLKSKYDVKTYKTFHCFPTSNKIELHEYKPFNRSFNGKVNFQ